MVALVQQKTSRWQAPLRLVREDEPVADRLGMERRVFPRRAANVSATGRRLDHSVPARRQPVLSLDVRDLSVGGLSAVTETPLAPGERIAVSFPRQGLKLGWDAWGRVLRCEPEAVGYRVAVEFESVPSAA